MTCRDAGYGMRDRGSERLRSVSRIPFPVSLNGYTLLELIVVVIVVAVLAGSLLSRIPYYQELAEKTAMENVSGALQSALVLRFGALKVRGGADRDINALETDNPVDWLQQKPRNYAGEFYDPSPGAVAPGHWMFDLKSRNLIYIVDRGDYFTPGKDGQRWIRFHVKIQYEPLPGSKQEVVAVLFEPAEPYHWFD